MNFVAQAQRKNDREQFVLTYRNSNNCNEGLWDRFIKLASCRIPGSKRIGVGVEEAGATTLVDEPCKRSANRLTTERKALVNRILERAMGGQLRYRERNRTEQNGMERNRMYIVDIHWEYKALVFEEMLDFPPDILPREIFVFELVDLWDYLCCCFLCMSAKDSMSVHNLLNVNG